MNKDRIKQELVEMLEAERRMLEALASDMGSEKEQKYICEKMFEVAEYIVTLKEYLEKIR
tara:strand:+ start:757 stop:936 length:180 start_codon:yes stop_codon:yes gene_type:complete